MNSFDTTTIRKSKFAERWERGYSSLAAGDVPRIRSQINPSFVPSGISGFILNKGDHVALFIEEDDIDYLPVLEKFLIAGYRSSSKPEILSLELSRTENAAPVKERMMAKLGRNFSDTIEIRDVDQNYSDYEPEHFTIEGMWDAMNHERRRFSRDESQHSFRCASEDCSLFLRWVDNPREYLRYESRLAQDLENIVCKGSVQLCAFRHSVLREMESIGKLNASIAVGEILASHSRVILLTHEQIVFDDLARAIIEREFPLCTKDRLAIKAHSIISRISAKLTPKSRLICS